MVQRIAGRLRKSIDASDIAAVAFLGVVLSAFGLEPVEIATVVSAVVVGPMIADAASGASDIDSAPGLAELAFGVLCVVAGVVHLRSASSWLGWVFVAVGGWLCLDGVYARRAAGDDPTTAREDDVTEGEVYLAGLHNRWLLTELREADRPLTKAELCDRTGLLEDDFERLLELHGESGPIERVGTGYAIDEREMGTGGIARAVGRRLYRPIRLFRPAG
ncbi:hypothetical protein [Natrinema marinum]|uniref:hypothetical protein n=1 Tax=Natrinema marinum TaxID=2961598 RepID=UPI0020C8D6C6|nr:hypothetical protein [Natrinema marinum]